MILHIHKVDALPETLQASSMYLVRNGATQTVDIYITDNTGATPYIASGSGMTESEVAAFIANILNEPGGIAGVNTAGLLDLSVGIHGQRTPIYGDNGLRCWTEIIQLLTVKGTSGGNNPTFGVVFGNFQGLLFSPSTMNQTWCDFHIGSNVAVGTNVYFHIHWCPISDDVGTVRFGVEYSIAEQGVSDVFPASTTIYTDAVVGVPSLGMHMSKGFATGDAVSGTKIKPGTVIKARLFRDAAHANDTFPEKIHIWSLDLAHQIERLGSVNRSPPFIAP